MSVHVPQVTVWFDGDCPLCQREIAMMRWLDWHQAIHFVDVSPAGGEAAYCPIDRAELLTRFHARESKGSRAGEGEVEGELLSGAAAFAAMWRAVPLLRPLGLAARNQTVLALLERAYRAFLRVRPRLQRWLGGSA